MKPHASALRCAYLPVEKYKESAAQWKNGLLGTVCFSSAPSECNIAALNMPLAQLPMVSLEADGMSGAACEVWGVDSAVTYGQHNGLRYAHNDELLFGVIQLPEAQFDATGLRESGKTPLQQAVESAYRTIFRVTDDLHFPHILRFWNYLADINGETYGMERYRQFNMGRQDGFLRSGRKVTGAVPAASAVGFDAGPLTVCFLAGRGAAPVAIENPRQVNAYAYPQDYGPRSPTFSRASVARIGDDDVLFLSGTASIVGHRTLHVGDVVAQTHETMVNIAAMVEEANRVVPQARFALSDLCYKVYVRHPRDVAAIDTELRRTLGASARRMFLRADICRQDLLMEIEATAGHPLEFAMHSSSGF